MAVAVRSITFHIARLLLSVLLVAFAYYFWEQGHPIYDKYLHAVRKVFYPESFGSSQVPYLGMTFEQLNKYLIKGEAGLFFSSGVLLFINQRRMAAWLLIMATLFILLTKDNFLMKISAIGSKANNSELTSRMMSFFRHISLLGIALILMDVGKTKSRHSH